MRIAHVSEAFGGGVQTAVVNYVTATPEHQHYLLIRSRPGHGTVDIPDSVPVSAHSGTIAGYLRHARREIVRGEFDIVHLHSSFAGLLRAVLPRRTAIVYSPHCYATQTRAPLPVRRAYHAIEKSLSLRPQVLAAVSPCELALGRALNSQMAATVVANCAPPPPPDPERADPCAGRSDLRPTIAMTGRICAQKDPRFFADVAELLRDKNFRFIWIGEGDDGDDALRAAGVEITGWLTPTQSLHTLRGADLYLHTAAWEGGPLAPLEAARVGCPVLSRTIGAMSSLGYPVAGDTPDQVAAAVAGFFGSADVRADTRNATEALLDAHSFDNMSRALRDAYRMATEL